MIRKSVHLLVTIPMVTCGIFSMGTCCYGIVLSKRMYERNNKVPGIAFGSLCVMSMGLLLTSVG